MHVVLAIAVFRRMWALYAYSELANRNIKFKNYYVVGIMCHGGFTYFEGLKSCTGAVATFCAYL